MACLDGGQRYLDPFHMKLFSVLEGPALISSIQSDKAFDMFHRDKVDSKRPFQDWDHCALTLEKLEKT